MKEGENMANQKKKSTFSVAELQRFFADFQITRDSSDDKVMDEIRGVRKFIQFIKSASGIE